MNWSIRGEEGRGREVGNDCERTREGDRQQEVVAILAS